MNIFLIAFLAWLFIPFASFPSVAADTSTVHVYIPTLLTESLIAGITDQYEADVVPGLFGSVKVTIHGEREGYVPPTVELPSLSTGTYIVQIGDDAETVYQSTSSIYHYFVTGFAFGMEEERKQDVKLVEGLRDEMLISGTCGGLIASTTVAADAFINGCWQGYNHTISTITLRSNAVPTELMPDFVP